MDAGAFPETVRRRLAKTGLTQHRAAIDHDLPPDAIRSVLDGHIPRLDRAAAICDALGIEFYVGDPRPKQPDTETGSPPPLPLRDMEAGVQTLARVVTDAGGDPIPEDLWPVLAERRGFVAPATDFADPSALAVGAVNEDGMPPGARPVDVHGLRVAAGGGALVESEEVRSQAWFRRDWLDHHGLDPTRCAILEVDGASMEPTLPDGCSVLVDRSRTRRRPGRIYVVRDGDGLIVKRAGKDADGGWLLTSENDAPEYAPIPWPEDAEVIGEVRWMAASFP